MLDTDLLAAYNAERPTRNTTIFCHAPFTSMNFAQNGDVTVCCYNRTAVLGTYPRATLADIWHGPTARQMRNTMARQSLPPGCDLCLEQFENRNFSALRARSYDHLSEARYELDDTRSFAFPKVMEFEISNVCNLECTMCNGFFSSSIRRNREGLPRLQNPYDEAFISQLEPFIPHLVEARFLGGEPFLNRAYYQIWDMVARLNPTMDVRITTNGTILNDRVRRLLDTLRVHVIVSIDSLQRDTYESIRLNANFDAVMKNLEYFRDCAAAKGTLITLAVCPMRQNWRDLPAIVNYCTEHQMVAFFNSVHDPPEATFEYMHHVELDEVLHYLNGAAIVENGAVGILNARHYRDMVNELIGVVDRKYGYAGTTAVSAAPVCGRLEVTTDDGATVRDIDMGVQPLRVAMDSEPSKNLRSVCLTVPVKFSANERYVVAFSARADSCRPVTLGARVPGPHWTDVGLMLDFWLTNRWERFETDFASSVDSERGELYFDVGSNRSAVEIADIRLGSFPDSAFADTYVRPWTLPL